ncbi:MAG: hypothetical protein ABJN34_15200 [Litoreibacter sp.]
MTIDASAQNARRHDSRQAAMLAGMACIVCAGIIIIKRSEAA